MRTQHSQRTEEPAREATVGQDLPRIQLNPTTYKYFHYKWAVQEIADWCTRILFWRDLSEEEQGRCFNELREYLPVRREQLGKCLNGEAPEDGLPRLLAKALES